MLRSDKFAEAGEPCLKQYRALTHVTTILKNNYTSVRNTWECRSGQLHLQIKFSRTRYFLLSFLTDCHRTGPEQTMKCAEHNLLQTTRAWSGRGHKDSYCTHLHMPGGTQHTQQKATSPRGKAEWTSSGSSATGKIPVWSQKPLKRGRRKKSCIWGKNASDVFHPAWERAQYH